MNITGLGNEYKSTYIYIYIERERERERISAGGPGLFFIPSEPVRPALELIESDALTADRVQKELVIMQIGLQVYA
jgi:hypothetical protein